MYSGANPLVRGRLRTIPCSHTGELLTMFEHIYMNVIW